MSDESRPEQLAQPTETPQEAQRNLPHFLSQVAEHAAFGAATWAGGYAAKTAKEKVFGGRGQDKDSGKPEPPSDPPAAETD
jgi:hypothetical protein